MNSPRPGMPSQYQSSYVIGDDASLEALKVNDGAVERGVEPVSAKLVTTGGPVVSRRTLIGDVALPALPSASVAETV